MVISGDSGVLALEITHTLKGKWHGSYGSCRCPVHDDKQPSMTVRGRGDDDVIVHCFAGCDWRDIKAELRLRGLLPGYRGDNVPTKTAEEREAERQKREAENAARRARYTEWCHRIWNESDDAANTPVETYLRGRGINSIPPTIRFHSALKHTDSGCLLSCMVAAVTRGPDNIITGIHRTYLDPHIADKASVTSAKKMAGDCVGGAVRLGLHDDRLALTEGIETGLSVQQATGLPTWACLSAVGLKGVLVPANVTEITIFADYDQAGIDAANEAAMRLQQEGKDVRIPLPNVPGTDFNDMLRGVA